MSLTVVDSDPIQKLFDNVTITKDKFLETCDMVAEKIRHNRDSLNMDHNQSFFVAIDETFRFYNITQNQDLWRSAIGSELGSRKSSSNKQSLKEKMRQEDRELQEYRQQEQGGKFKVGDIYISFGDVMSVIRARRDHLIDDL